ncbi:TPA: hypothetical protein JBI12_02705 [Legionella pneumophila]|nr:hypothetical protein [Legionella pneumophila]
MINENADSETLSEKEKLYLIKFYQGLRKLILDHHTQSINERKPLLIVLGEEHKNFPVVIIKEMINEIIKEINLKNVYVELDAEALKELYFQPSEIRIFITDTEQSGLNVIPVDDQSRSSHDGSMASMARRDHKIVSEVNTIGEGGFLSVGFEHMEGLLTNRNGASLSKDKFHILAINSAKPISLEQSVEMAKGSAPGEEKALISRQQFYSKDSQIIQCVLDGQMSQSIHDKCDTASLRGKLNIKNLVTEISQQNRMSQSRHPSGFFSQNKSRSHSPVNSGVFIEQNHGQFQLHFTRDHLEKAKLLILQQFGEGGAGYFDADLAKLDHCRNNGIDFVMEFPTLELLKTSIEKIGSPYLELKRELEMIVSDFEYNKPYFEY